MAKPRTRSPGRPRRRAGERLSKNRTFRVRGQLDKQLQQAAADAERSVSEEIEYRLESSFSRESALGGPELQRIVYLMAGTFGHRGSTEAAALGHPEWAPRDWLRDQACYRSAMLAVMTALLELLPDNSPVEIALAIEALKTHALNISTQELETK